MQFREQRGAVISAPRYKTTTGPEIKGAKNHKSLHEVSREIHRADTHTHTTVQGRTEKQKHTQRHRCMYAHGHKLHTDTQRCIWAHRYTRTHIYTEYRHTHTDKHTDMLWHETSHPVSPCFLLVPVSMTQGLSPLLPLALLLSALTCPSLSLHAVHLPESDISPHPDLLSLGCKHLEGPL